MKTPDILEKREGQDVPFLKDLAACTKELKERGYKEDFRVDEDGLKTYGNSDKAYQSNEIKILNFYRFEGVSDPGDMAVLYVIETNDGIKGTLSDGYGPYASEDVSKFIVKVKEIQKEIPQANA
ncbi:hypothetical protein [Chryseosolibacter indicus]|uniref:Phosphoribosylpyrophosphate synthetase n=1 Tax=Chryseosolibacter indicus TaxID=2782351 RepID=A0ABS5VN31_9BACT|nr:hypothetical protein [Chryseosolibacter indicus]MBT1702428.1 hypothetical protein [Chryseosolibacter indicus]